MPKKSAGKRRTKVRTSVNPSVSLRQLADYVGLAPATVSLVMNAVPDSGIAPGTRDRILAAAKKLNYRPNFFARVLRTQKSFTIGVLVPEMSEGYTIGVLRGIEEHLQERGYSYFVASHHLHPESMTEHLQVFRDRSVDGLIVVSAEWNPTMPIPVTTISSYHRVPGTTSVMLDHRVAVELALRHLLDLGHRRIAFIKGTAGVPDTEVRWNAIVKMARDLRLEINPRLVVQIDDPTPSGPHLGYGVTQKLLALREPFTALFAFNDVSAMGAIRALTEFCLRVPEDVSVIGFDDIESAAYLPRGLTTIRQPLKEMGRLAAESLLRRIETPKKQGDAATEYITVLPELIVRETTSVPANQAKGSRGSSKARGRRSL